MKSCFAVSSNITIKLMGTTIFLWEKLYKKGMGVLFDWRNARIFLWPFSIKLAMIRSRPFKFSSATICLFKQLFLTISSNSLIRNFVKSWDCSPVSNNEIELGNCLPLSWKQEIMHDNLLESDVLLRDLKHFYRNSVRSRNWQYYTVK